MPDEEPQFLTRIPDDEPEHVKKYMRAQQVIQAAFYSYFPPDHVGEKNIEIEQMIEVMGIAIGMLVASDHRLSSPSQVRESVDLVRKQMLHVAKGLREAGDDTASRLLAIMGVVRSGPTQ